MNFHEEVKSIGALEECMRSLGFHIRGGEIRSIPARLRHAHGPILPGEILVRFERRDLNKGPEITCDAHIMKGYGIMFDNFEPWFQRFSFDPAANELRITSEREGGKYDFTFCF